MKRKFGKFFYWNISKIIIKNLCIFVANKIFKLNIKFDERNKLRKEKKKQQKKKKDKKQKAKNRQKQSEEKLN